mgnify:CR=1 FL=1
MTRPVILLDVDGVLADFITANLRTLHAFGAGPFAHDDVTAWSIEDSLGLTSSQRARMKARWSEPGFCASIPPYEGAQAGVEALRAIGEVYAVTAPMWSGPTWQHERTEWLVKHFDFRREDVVSTAAKHLVRGDVLVEDKPEALHRWSSSWPDGLGVLWHQPYNAGAEWPIASRVSGWSELRRALPGASR